MRFARTVPAELVGRRLDQVIAALEPTLSRAQAQRWIADGAITVNGARARAAQRVRLGEQIEGALPEPTPSELIAEPIALAITYEDSDLIVVDKPAGLVVHPAAGHARGTLVNALLHHCKDLAGIGGELRPGIVHRIDKDTSGLLVVAKNDATLRALAALWKKHELVREYLAFVRGAPPQASGMIDAPIGRHPLLRKKMSTRSRVARSAVSHWRVEAKLKGATLLRVGLETGRTHQIRVHLGSIGLPILGDRVYGCAEAELTRQALHAAVLGFVHPRTGETLRFESPLPPDLARLFERLQ